MSSSMTVALTASWSCWMNPSPRPGPRWPRKSKTYFAGVSPRLKLVCPPLVIEGGERTKNSYFHVSEIHSHIDRYHIDRHSYVIAVGGGALLDMAGFAAATAHRGVRHVRIPTTTLSQADSGVGVKNGINAFGKKNFIGAFAPPFAVINDFAIARLPFRPRQTRRLRRGRQSRAHPRPRFL